jgi:hypothetical protein
VEWITRFRKTEAKYFCEKGWTRHFGKRASDLPVGQITSPMDKGPSMSSGHDRRKLTSGRGQPELIDRSAEHRRNLGLQIRPGDVCKGRIHGKGAEPALGLPELGQHGALVGRHVVERPTCGVLRGPRRHVARVRQSLNSGPECRRDLDDRIRTKCRRGRRHGRNRRRLSECDRYRRQRGKCNSKRASHGHPPKDSPSEHTSGIANELGQQPRTVM